MELQVVIKKVLKAKNWTQADLGKRLGVNQSQVSKMYLGPRWDKHWKVLLRLLELAKEVGVFDPDAKKHNRTEDG